MLDTMLMGGNIAMLGIPSTPYPVDLGKIVGKALTVKGIYGRQMYETWYKMLSLLDSGLEMSAMITHRFPASEWQQAFDLMETRKAQVKLFSIGQKYERRTCTVRGLCACYGCADA